VQSTTGAPSNIWVIGGGSSSSLNSLAYSYDTSTWVSLGNITFTSCRKLRYINNKFYAFGSGSNTYAFSDNGIVWNGFGSNIPLQHIAFGNGFYIGVDNSSNIYKSFDGIEFTLTNNTALFSRLCVIYSEKLNLFLAGGEFSLAYSSDGVLWTNAIVDLEYIGDCKNITYNDDVYVVVGRNINGVSVIYSYDGITWLNSNLGAMTGSVNDIVWNGSVFIINGLNTLAYSSDGINWTQSFNVSFFRGLATQYDKLTENKREFALDFETFDESKKDEL
jgi:hypothetical protein